ncbi:BTB/POZ protein [Phyllosticta capitalensis]
MEGGSKTDKRQTRRSRLVDAESIQLSIPIRLDVLHKIRDNDEPGKDLELVNSRFRQLLNNYFPTGQFSDLTIQFPDGQKLRVHKALVCAFSEVFHKAVSGPFNESITGVIEISFEDTEAVFSMIQWMYTGTHATPEEQSPLPEEQSPLVFHIRLYAAADFYQVNSLKREMIRCILPQLRDQFNPDSRARLTETFELIFSCTPEPDRWLRDAVVAFCAENYARCSRIREFQKIESADFWRSLCLGGDDYYTHYDGQFIRSYEEYMCENCKGTFLVPEEHMSSPDAISCCYCYQGDGEYAFAGLGRAKEKRIIRRVGEL